jgi:hypothetical protein
MYRSLTFYTSKKVVKVIGYSSQTDSKAEEVCQLHISTESNYWSQSSTSPSTL